MLFSENINFYHKTLDKNTFSFLIIFINPDILIWNRKEKIFEIQIKNNLKIGEIQENVLLLPWLNQTF